MSYQQNSIIITANEEIPDWLQCKLASNILTRGVSRPLGKRDMREVIYQQMLNEHFHEVDEGKEYTYKVFSWHDEQPKEGKETKEAIDNLFASMEYDKFYSLNQLIAEKLKNCVFEQNKVSLHLPFCVKTLCSALKETSDCWGFQINYGNLLIRSKESLRSLRDRIYKEKRELTPLSFGSIYRFEKDISNLGIRSYEVNCLPNEGIIEDSSFLLSWLLLLIFEATEVKRQGIDILKYNFTEWRERNPIKYKKLRALMSVLSNWDPGKGIKQGISRLKDLSENSRGLIEITGKRIILTDKGREELQKIHQIIK